MGSEEHVNSIGILSRFFWVFERIHSDFEWSLWKSQRILQRTLLERN